MKTLFDDVDGKTIQERFDRFVDENPHVYELFTKFAKQAREAGHKRYSADALLHRIRWHETVEVKRDAGEFKINDHFSSRMARKLIDDDPTFADFFETRKLKAT